MPAPSISATAAAASGLGWSASATKATRVSSSSAASRLVGGRLTRRSERASTRLPVVASFSTSWFRYDRSLRSSGTVSPAAVIAVVHIASTTSGAPFTSSRNSPSAGWSVVIRFRSESNGSSSTRG